MKIKLTLLTIFTLVACTLIGNTPSCELSYNTMANAMHSLCSNNEIEVIINDSNYKQGDTYTINVYYLNTLYASKTTNSLNATIAAPIFWRDNNLVVEVEKHNALSRDFVGLPQIIIATEVRFPAELLVLEI